MAGDYGIGRGLALGMAAAGMKNRKEEREQELAFQEQRYADQLAYRDRQEQTSNARYQEGMNFRNDQAAQQQANADRGFGLQERRAKSSELNADRNYGLQKQRLESSEKANATAQELNEMRKKQFEFEMNRAHSEDAKQAMIRFHEASKAMATNMGTMTDEQKAAVNERIVPDLQALLGDQINADGPEDLQQKIVGAEITENGIQLELENNDGKKTYSAVMDKYRKKGGKEPGFISWQEVYALSDVYGNVIKELGYDSPERMAHLWDIKGKALGIKPEKNDAGMTETEYVSKGLNAISQNSAFGLKPDEREAAALQLRAEYQGMQAPQGEKQPPKGFRPKSKEVEERFRQDMAGKPRAWIEDAKRKYKQEFGYVPEGI